jgi:hypothetical protein
MKRRLLLAVSLTQSRDLARNNRFDNPVATQRCSLMSV